MRFRFDPRKSRDVLRKHGISLDQAREVFDQIHVLDQKNDDPAQYRAIGWSQGELYAVMFEVRRDALGEYYHLITAWKATQQEQQAYAENI